MPKLDRRHIIRLRPPQTPAYVVRFVRAGRAITRCFSFSVHGGARAALAAAIAYRDRAAKRIPPSARPRPTPVGHGYVQRGTVKGHPAWVGWCKLERGRAARSAARIDLWGDAGAERMARAWLRRTRAALRARGVK